MTPDELRDARRAIGEALGLGRPLHASEMGRLLRLQGRDPGESVRDYERGKTSISGPVSLAVELLQVIAQAEDAGLGAGAVRLLTAGWREALDP